jgi:hypothetical protein
MAIFPVDTAGWPLQARAGVVLRYFPSFPQGITLKPAASNLGMWASIHRRGTNKLVLYSLLLMMVLFGTMGPLIQTLDDDENLGITFPETRIVGHNNDLERNTHFSPDAPSIVTHLFNVDFPIDDIVIVLKSHTSAKLVVAILAIPLRT